MHFTVLSLGPTGGGCMGFQYFVFQCVRVRGWHVYTTSACMFTDGSTCVCLCCGDLEVAVSQLHRRSQVYLPSAGITGGGHAWPSSHSFW